MSDANKEEKSEKIYFQVLWKKNEQQKIEKWWQDLENNRGERAKLRRCATPEEVLLQPCFHELQYGLPEIKNTLALAAVAGLLAHIKNNTHIPFAEELAEQKEKSGKPVFSELRFQQLLASRDLNELYENLRRAIMQTNRTANILSIADGVLHWVKEQHDKNQFTDKPEKRFQFTWAKAYFSKVLTYSKAA